MTQGALTPTDVVQQAGRGTIYIGVAKAYFMATGLAIYVVLPRVLTVEQFGLYSVVVGVTSVINAVVMNGTVLTVSRFVAGNVERVQAIKSKALHVQALIGGSIAVVYYGVAPWLAGALHDERLTTYFQLTALITLAYAFYAVFMGVLNGRRQFLRQAFLDSMYSTFKVVFVIGMAWLSGAVMGALMGWVIAGVAALVVSIGMVGRAAPVGQVQAKELLRFQSWLLVYTLIINLLQKVDLLLVKALSSSDPVIASEQAGYYNAVMTIANVVFQSIVAITSVAFPFVAQAASGADHRAIKQYMTHTMRFSLMVMACLATLFVGNAGGLLGLIYRPEYLAGTDALRIAPFGMLMFGWLSVLCSLISGSGHPRVAVGLAAITCLADAVLNSLFIPVWGLAGAAAATLIAMSLGVALGSVYVHRQFDAQVSWHSLLRIAAVAVIVLLASDLIEVTGALVLVKLGMQALVFVGLLVMVKEISTAEFWAIKRLWPTRHW